MKKLMSVLLCVVLAGVLVGCGGTGEEAPTESATESSSYTPEPSTEPLNQESEAPTDELSSTEPSLGMSEIELEEIRFTTYDYEYIIDQENQYVDFTIDEGVAWGRVSVLQKMNMIENTTEDDQLLLTMGALVSGFDDYTEISINDLTLAGNPAKMGQYMVTHTGTAIEFTDVVFSGETNTYAFMLYLTDNEDDEELTEFLKIVGSVEFK